jgi:MFS family permease
MLPIETQHGHISWRWLLLVGILTLGATAGFLASGSMIFTMRLFIDSPAVINSISSLDVLFNVLVAATCLYLSDRIWTRFGRRIPFLVVAWTGMALCLFFLPLAGNVWTMGLVVVGWLIFVDVSSVSQTLQMEIVPPHQRGRFSALNQWLFQLLIIFLSLAINGRFDDTVHRGDTVVGGDKFIYWMGAACLAACVLFTVFFIRERRPTEPPPPSHGGGWKGVIGNLFAEKTLWPIYLLAFCQVLIETGLGAIDPLLITEQWGYSKQDIGTNIFVGGMINLFLIPIIGYLVDRMDRMTMFALGVGGGLVLQIGYYVFIQFMLPDRRPEIFHMIVFGQLISIAGLFKNTAFLPLTFDYIPRDQMGTAQAGLNFVRSITRLITLNGIGFWVVFYSSLFMPEGTYDYFSGYLFMILMNVIGCAFLAYFMVQAKRGKILPLGRTGFQPVAETPAPVTPAR